jgi:flagellar hook-basal body complex protein FliE
MRVEPLVPDIAPSSIPDVAPSVPDMPLPSQNDAGDAAGFGSALDAVAQTLAGATRAEDAFAYGRGTLQEAVYERARADVALSVATATATRIAQAVQSVSNMQV